MSHIFLWVIKLCPDQKTDLFIPQIRQDVSMDMLETDASVAVEASKDEGETLMGPGAINWWHEGSGKHPENKWNVFTTIWNYNIYIRIIDLLFS